MILLQCGTRPSGAGGNKLKTNVSAEVTELDECGRDVVSLCKSWDLQVAAAGKIHGSECEASSDRVLLIRMKQVLNGTDSFFWWVLQQSARPVTWATQRRGPVNKSAAAAVWRLHNTRPPQCLQFGALVGCSSPSAC